MNEVEFLADALKTWSEDDKFMGGDTVVSAVIHATMGLRTELAELLDALKKRLIYGKPIDVTNVLEECGDILWYAALYAHTRGETFADLRKGVLHLEFRKTERVILDDTSLSVLFRAIGLGLTLANETDDYVASMWFDGNPIIWEYADDRIGALLVITEKILELHDLTLPQAMEANIAKLKVRYGEKFTPEAALTRDLEREGKALRIVKPDTKKN